MTILMVKELFQHSRQNISNIHKTNSNQHIGTLQVETVKQAINDYEAYRSRFSQGLLNAAIEDELTGSIQLTDSKLKLPFVSKSFLDIVHNNLIKLDTYSQSVDKNKHHDTAFLIKAYPEVEEILRVLEVAYHEVFHAIQKHTYRSVYSLVEALQNIEDWENMLFFSYAGAGGKWQLGESFISCLYNIDLDKHIRNSIASQLSMDCKKAIVASTPRNGLTLMHLIEGQTLITSRIATKILHVIPLPDADLYTTAWNKYKSAGGSEAIVFVLLTGAALRYGEIDGYEDTEDSEEFYPHPVDIFHYLLNYVDDIEGIFKTVDTAPIFESITPNNYHQQLQQLINLVKSRKYQPKDSSDPLLSYLYNNKEPSERRRREHKKDIYHHFEPGDISTDANQQSSDLDALTKNLMLVSGAISKIIEHSYTRVPNSMMDQFTEKGNKIAQSVGYNVALMIPEYYLEKTVIRYLTDLPFVLGTLFPYFLNTIDKQVMVKPFSSIPEMTHLDYRSMRLMPDMIKKLLYIYAWRQGDLHEGESPQSPYCCAKHGMPPLLEASPNFFDACQDSEAVGKALKIMFNRSVSEFFEI